MNVPDWLQSSLIITMILVNVAMLVVSDMQAQRTGKRKPENGRREPIFNYYGKVLR